jgi:DNA-binding GntR family transcriptional regulator
MDAEDTLAIATDGGFRLAPVQPRNLSDEVHGQLRAAILTQDIQAGTRLYEAALATSLGVSRAPVREALRQLEQEGLVHSYPRRGAIVVTLPEDEIEAFYALRADIEARAFARATQHITDEDVDALQETLDDLRVALDRRDVDAITAADLRFHSAVLDLSGFTLLRRVWSSLEGPLRLRVIQFTEASIAAHQPSPPESERYPHSVLLDALRARDPEAAAVAARGHVIDVQESIRALADAGARAITGAS